MLVKPTILFTTPYLRYPAAGGYLLCIDNSLKALARISTLHVHSRGFLEPSDHLATAGYYRRFCETLHLPSPLPPPRPGRGSVKDAARHLAGRMLGERLRRVVRQAVVDRRDRDDILRIAAQVRPDLIWMEYGVISFALVRLVRQATACKLAVHTDAVYSRAILDGLPYARSAAARRHTAAVGKTKLAEEQWGPALGDVTTAVSDIDVEYYRGVVRSPERVQLFANVIDLDQYNAVPPEPPSLRHPCICLVGTFWKDDAPLGVSPMEDAARWFIGSILPIVRQQIPEIHLYVIGVDSDIVVGDLAGPAITVTGRLPSVLEYLHHADIVVTPIRFGSGTRYKILEAGACATPVVSTSLGAEGLGVEHGEHLLLADTAEDFAGSIIQLLRDQTLAQRLTSNLRELVRTRFNVEALAEQGRHILRRLDLMRAT